MGVYARALLVICGGLLGGSVGLYYQGKEEKRLAELRALKLSEMRRLNRDSVPDSSGPDTTNGNAMERLENQPGDTKH
ncbi:hypothetical protein H4R19_000898 [Coemansia spiralis]|nr:hypothetical protein H4R19_000898 [Coemansia spiralis]